MILYCSLGLTINVINSKYHLHLPFALIYNSNLQFTRCYISEFALYFLYTITPWSILPSPFYMVPPVCHINHPHHFYNAPQDPEGFEIHFSLRWKILDCDPGHVSYNALQHHHRGPTVHSYYRHFHSPWQGRHHAYLLGREDTFVPQHGQFYHKTSCKWTKHGTLNIPSFSTLNMWMWKESQKLLFMVPTWVNKRKRPRKWKGAFTIL